MITTGSPRSSATKTEIIDVTNGFSCSDLANFPVGIDGSVGANLDGTPVVCGGSLNPEFSEKCYRFTDGGWAEFTSMKEKRDGAAGIVYNKKLHVFGGRSSMFSKSKTSEIISVDGVVNDGPDLPIAVEGHKMTAINDTMSILSGGVTSADSHTTQTWYYDHERESFTRGPDLVEGRRDHGSATITMYIDVNVNVKIPVVTGGFGNNGAMTSTELLINGQWQPGTTIQS